MMPGGFRNHADQPHSFAFYGWGTALTFLHVPWQAVPEWKLGLLDHLRVLIVPSADIFPQEDVVTLQKWVEDGGSLVIAGPCGARLGEAGNFERCAAGSTLLPLAHEASQHEATLGKGRVISLAADPALDFYRASAQRPGQLPVFAKIIQDALQDRPPLILDASKVDWKTNLSLHRDANSLFVDVANTNIDLPSDAVTPTPAITFTLTLPAGWNRDRVKVEALSPDDAPSLTTSFIDDSHLEITVGPIRFYTCLVIRNG
jgi:hypothetical protein